MNSEELELSLRTEFESYLKGFLADLRQEVSEFQKSFETEFEKHKAQTDEALRKLVVRFEKDLELDRSFNESVVEHLRLARDEGATITAIAIGEAEKLKAEAVQPAEAAYDKLRDAVNQISSKTSQSEILGTLVEHAAEFAPRGVFFIVKNERFVGWRGFGKELTADEEQVRSVQLPASTDTVLSSAIESLSTTMSVAGAHQDDRLFLDALGLGSPDRLYAVPLIARGRGVAVLYADYGSEGVALNPEALETLVRVAGLTVELAAAGVQPAPVATRAAEPEPVRQPESPSADETYSEQHDVSDGSESSEAQFDEHLPPADVSEAPVESEPAPDVSFESETEAADQRDFVFAETPVVDNEHGIETGFEAVPVEVEHEQDAQAAEAIDQFETIHDVPADAISEIAEEHAPVEVEHFDAAVVEEVEAVEEVAYFEPVEEAESVPTGDTEFSDEAPEEPSFTVSEEFPEVIDERRPAVESPTVGENGASVQVTEPLAEVASAQASRSKYRDRNIDLPIEVPEEERRLHNDARRFARLLVSEIKLYNEQKVEDGRQAGDLYDRLREAIDRSREMYDKRVQQPVAEKFDYFHYELVTSLAEGDDVKLGASYPGSRVPA